MSLRSRLAFTRAGRPTLLVLACLGPLLLLLPASSPAQGFTFRNVVDTTTAVPGQSGTFTSFNSPSISGTNLAFNGNYTGGNGIYAGVAGGTSAPVRVADRTTAVPGQSGTFTGFGTFPAISGTNVTFGGNYTGGSGVYAGVVGGAPAPSLVADRTTTAPGQSGTFTGFNDPSISGANVAFIGSYPGGSGVYAGVAGGTSAPVRVADRTTAVPGQSGTFTGFATTPYISGTTVAFGGSYTGGGVGLYTQKLGSATPVRVADGTTAVPGRSGSNFTGFSDPTISGNHVGFLGFYNGGFGIYTGAADGTSAPGLVADFNTTVPGQGSKFAGFGSPAVSGDNEAFIGAYYDAGGSFHTGVFLELGNTALLDAINTGDPLFGSTVTSLSLGTFGLDGTTLAYGYTLANGVSGEAVATFSAVPEPSTWALLTIGGAGLLCLGRRTRRVVGAARA